MKYFTTFFLLYFYKYEVQLSISFSFLHFYVITLLRSTWLLMTRCCQNGRFKQKICLEKRLSCLAVSSNFSNFCVHIQILLSSNAWAIQFLFTCEHSKTCYEFVFLSNHFCPAVWTVTTCLSRIGWQFSVSSFFFHILFWFIMLQELELYFLFQSQFSFSFENLLQIVRVAFISGRILVSKLIYSDSR